LTHGSHHGRGGKLPLQWTGASPRITSRAGLLLLRFEAADGWHCRVTDFKAGVLAEIVLPEAHDAHATLHAGHLLVLGQARTPSRY
jgi:hypothetical protein